MPGAGDAGGVHFDFGGFDFGGGGGGAGPSFRDLFSQYFRGGAAAEAPSHAEPGSSLEYQIEITFWEAVRGTVKKLTISRLDACADCRGTGTAGQPQSCTACGGSGQVTQTSGKMRFNLTCTRCGGTGRTRNICRACGGDGRVRRADTIEIRIPAGVQTGSRVRVPGRGNAGTAGEPPGDLYIITDVQPHPFFDRRGDDIYITVPIPSPRQRSAQKSKYPRSTGLRGPCASPRGPTAGRSCACAKRACPRFEPRDNAGMSTSNCKSWCRNRWTNA